VSSAVFSYPDITAVPDQSALDRLGEFPVVCVLENHNPSVAKARLISDGLLSETRTRVVRLGLDGIPANGQAAEVLNHHRLDSASIASDVAEFLKG
jgi:transketolase C-terminal domain/subunit